MIRIAAISDTHEDERASCAGKIVLGPDGINIRAADRRRCFRSAVDGAIERKVNLILHGGDLFEGEQSRNRPKPTPTEYVAVERELDRAADFAPTVVPGDNHGMSGGPTEEHAIAPLAGRHPRLFVCLRPDLLNLETKAGRVQVAVLPFPQKSILLAKEEYAGIPPETVNQLIGEKLAAILRGFRARLDASLPSICLTHMMLREAVFGSDRGPETGTLMLSAEAFDGFDLVVSGDVHRHQMIGKRILIPGGTDRTDFGEEHEAKGWCYVELDGPGAVPRVELVETPARRFVTLSPGDIQETDPAEYLAHDLTTMPILRVKGRVSQEEYDTLHPFLARWREIPTFSGRSWKSPAPPGARREHARGSVSSGRPGMLVYCQWQDGPVAGAARGASGDCGSL